MEQHDQRIMPRCDLHRAARHQAAGVAPGDQEFAAALQGDEEKDREAERHAAFSKTTQLVEKPGPMALTTQSSGRPSAITRSSTNRTVGADMLP